MIIICKFCRVHKDKCKTVKFRFISPVEAVVMCDKCYTYWNSFDRNSPFSLTIEERDQIKQEIMEQIRKES